MKRLLSVFLCIVMLMSTCVAILPASAASDVQLNVSGAECKPGESATVTVSLKSNPGFAYICITPTITDPTGTVVKDITWTASNGSLFSDMTVGSNVIFLAESNVRDLGTLLTFKVDIPEDAAEGAYTFALKVRECYDENENDVPVSVVPGTITVKGDDVPEIPEVPAKDIVVKLSSTEIIKGTKTNLTITIEENPGFFLLSATPYFMDSDGNEVTGFSWSAVNGTIFSDVTFGKNLLFMGDDNVSATGILATLKLSVDASLPAGTYTFGLKINECYDADEKTVPMSVTYGTVTVKDVEKPRYEISFVDWDGKIISSQIYSMGDAIIIPADPTRPEDADYTYTFAGWAPAVSKVAAGDATYCATYTATAKAKDLLIDLSAGAAIKKGETLSIAIDMINNPGIMSAIFTPVIRDSLGNDVTSAFTIAAEKGTVMSDMSIDKNIVFLNGGNTTATGLLAMLNITAGDTVGAGEYALLLLPREIYDENEEPITTVRIGSTSFIVEETVSTVRTVKFVDWDGTVLSEKEYNIGDTVSQPKTPTRAADADYMYTFAGWSPAFSAVCTDNVTYVAKYNQTPIKPAADAVRIEIDSKTVSKGREVIVPVYVTHNPGFMSATLSVKITDADGNTVSGITLSDLTAGDMFKASEIEFGKNIVILGSKDYTKTGTLMNLVLNVADSVELGTYFVNLISRGVTNYDEDDIPAEVVAGSLTVVDKYTVTFKNYDGKIISEKEYAYGDAIVIPSATPTKPSDVQYNYTFSGWTPEITTICDSDATYTATFDKTLRKYTVKFLYENGSVYKSYVVEYGSTCEIPAGPAKSADKTYTYSFAGWTPEVTAVTGDTSYSPVYNKTYIDYTVEFYSESGELIESKVYHYGDTVNAPEAPEKAKDADYFYSFKEWSGFSGICTGNSKHYATYNNHAKASTPHIVIESKTYMEGKTGEIKVFIKNNPGFMSATFTPIFDDALILKEVKGGELIKSVEYGINIVTLTDNDVTADGHLFTLVFEIPEGTEPGDYTISFKVRGCVNEAGRDVELAFVEDGTLTVIDFLWGDANGDGFIDNKDLVRVKKYIAGYDYDTGTSDTEVEGGADANGDGIIDNKDLVRLKKYIAGYDYDTGTSDVVLGPTA